MSVVTRFLIPPLAIILLLLSTPAVFAGEVIRCDIDFDADGKLDIAVVAADGEEKVLLVLLNRQRAYQEIRLSHMADGENMECRRGRYVTETKAGRSKGIAIKTPGSYVRLSQPESSSHVFFWDKEKSYFTEVWTAD